MIASVRGVLALLVLALVLGILVLVAAPGAPVGVDRSLAPGLAVESVTQLEIRHAGAAPLVLARGPRGWTLPGGVPANPSTVDALLTALRAGSWQRRAPVAAAGHTGDQLVAGGITLAIGEPLAGTDQVWLVRGTSALLVDGWIARALAPGPLELRIRQPLAGAPGAKQIAGGPVRLEGNHLIAPVTLWLDPAAVRDVAAQLAELSILSLERGTPGPATYSITVDGITVSDAGTCGDDDVWITAPTGDGCVDSGAWMRARAVLAGLADHATLRVDTRPLPLTPSELTLPDGGVLTLGAHPSLGKDEVDLDRINELLDALATPGTAVSPPATPVAGGPTLRARDAEGHEVTLMLLRDRVVQRPGEPVALEVPLAAWSALTRSSGSLRDTVRWREEVTTLSSLTVDGTRYQRGAVLGEWTRGAGAAAAAAPDGALVDALASALATVRGPAGEPLAQVAHRVTVTFTPPAGATSTHTLELGAMAAQRCPARVDGAPVLLSLELCTAAYALASSR